MVIAILAPEILLGLVCGTFLSVRRNTKKLRWFAETDRVPWSETHSWFADQGGVFIHLPPNLSDRRATDSVARSLRLDSDELAIEMGSMEGQGPGLPFNPGTPWFNERQEKYDRRRVRATRTYGSLPGEPCASFRKYVQEEASTALDGESRDYFDDCLGHISDTWAVSSWQLLFLREKGIIERLPLLLEGELQDRNKSDAVVRLLAIIQVFWLAMQLVTRAARGLPVATLEISTVAYVASSLVIYLLQWDSIKDLTVPMRWEASRLPTKEEFIRIINNRGKRIRIVAKAKDLVLTNDTYHVLGSYFFSLAAGGGLLFGAIHLAAWDFAFPTILEQTLWRTSALVTVVTPMLDALGIWIARSYMGRSLHKSILDWILWVIFVLYVAARLFLLVESFRSLYFLPPDAYKTKWTKNAPHFG